MFEARKKIPLWVRPFLGLGLVVLGVVLALNSSASIQVFVALTGLGLVTVGVVRIIDAFKADPDDEYGLQWVTGISGVLLAGTGIATLVWRGATLPMLALSVAILLLLSGATSLVSLFRKGNTNRTSSLLGGLAALATGGLVFAWPKLTLWAFGVFFGGWLVFTGLQLVIGFMARGKDRSPTPAKLKLRSFGKIAGSALALVLAVSMVLVTSFIHAGDPKLVPDSFYTPPTDLPAVPGQLLRVGELTEGIPENASAWRFLYTTTNPDGTPAVASGSAVVPPLHCASWSPRAGQAS